MPLDTAANLVDSLRGIRLLEPEQLSEVVRDLLPRFAEPRALAGELIRRGWLTPYQVNQLQQGRGGELTLGSYVLLERIGEGGMGQVFKAKNWKLGRVVALKLIRKERLVNDDAVRRFHREIRAAAQLSHPNIVMAYDADEVNGTHFFAMEYAEGADLAKLVKQHGPLPVAQACGWMRQAALGLQHAHERGLVHRDVKPHNLLLTKQGVVKVLDLGLAHLGESSEEEKSSSRLTEEGAVMGTLDYIAPEQVMDSHSVDLRADLYSLGCTLYHLLTGRPPFPGGRPVEKLYKHRHEEPTPVEQRRPDVPVVVAALVRRLMAKRPEDRYQTSAELVQALDGLVYTAPAPPREGDSRTGTSGGRVGPAGMPMHDTVNEALDFRPTDEEAQALAGQQRSRRRTEKRLLLAGAGCCLLLLGLALGLSLLFGRSKRSRRDEPTIAAEQSRPSKKTAISFEEWVEEVRTLPAKEQVSAVARKLQERNPGFDGKVKPTIHDGEITWLEFLPDNVTDLAPVRALPKLEALAVGRFGQKTKLADLGPLRGLPLKGLWIFNSQVRDLSPLRGMPLENLEIYLTRVTDLSPLRGMPLRSFNCAESDVSDLSPLRGAPLLYLHIFGSKVSDLSPLRGMELEVLGCERTSVTDLSPLRGMPLKELHCEDSKVVDLSPLKGMPLTNLTCDFKPERDTEILRSIETLEKINGKLAAEFWKEAGK